MPESFNPTTLNEEQLLACVNELMTRCVVAVPLQCSGTLTVNISCSTSSDQRLAGTYEIHHRVTLEQKRYSLNEQKLAGGNAIELTRKAARRWYEDEGLQPVQVQPMLAPPSEPEVEYAHFEPIPNPAPQHNADLDDDVPF